MKYTKMIMSFFIAGIIAISTIGSAQAIQPIKASPIEAKQLITKVSHHGHCYRYRYRHGHKYCYKYRYKHCFKWKYNKYGKKYCYRWKWKYYYKKHKGYKGHHGGYHGGY